MAYISKLLEHAAAGYFEREKSCLNYGVELFAAACYERMQRKNTVREKLFN